MAVPEVGTVIADMRIDAVLGRGGMGVVYRAHQLALDRTVALKVINSDLSEDADFRERFRREARLAAAIDHPNVVPVLHAGAEDGHLLLVMRFVDGVDLATLLREHGPLDRWQATRITAQVADALDAAHARGMVHRDVKPANVLLNRRPGGWHAYLTDFGISKELHGGGPTQSGVVLGSLGYISPEALEGGAVDPRADVYSLGCLLFEALTGQVPFPRPSTAAQIYAHMQAPPPPLGSVRPELTGPLEPVVARALAKRPAERFATAGELGRSAMAVVNGGSTAQAAATPVSSPLGQPAPSWPAPNRPGPGGGVGAGVGGGPGWPGPGGGGPSRPGPAGTGPGGTGWNGTGPGGVGPGGAAPGWSTPQPLTRVDAPPRRRLPWILAAVAAALVVVAVILVVTVTRSGTGGGGTVAAPTTSAAALPAAGQIVGAPIRVGAGPYDLEGGEGYVWTANRNGRSVSRIDPKSGASTEIEVGGAPGELVIGHGKAWVWNYSSGITPVDAATGKVGELIRTEIDFTGIVGTRDAVWFAAADRKQIGRIDMTTGTYTGKLVDLPGRADSMDAVDGKIYVLSRAERIVSTVDEASGKVIDQRPLPNDLGTVAAENGRVYVLGPAGVAELPPAPAGVGPITPLDKGVSGLVFDQKSLWLVDQDRHELRRVALDLRTPVSQPLVGVITDGDIDMESIDGTLWICRAADDSVLRVQPGPL